MIALSPSFDVDEFLRDDWQQRPRLIRNPWNAWLNPLDPDELAGLACEPGIEARIVMHGPKGWRLENGPFAEACFGKLGKLPWTLLVQAVDHHVPEVAALIEPFRFVPDWRIDDVMVSYASQGGGVGPHYDQYDVFLIQGLGRRRWQIGRQCGVDDALVPHAELRLLADFETVDEWILEPGDILYVPPRFAHNGVAASDDCMTYSIGFRAPARSELVAHWCDHVLEHLDDSDRYEDRQLPRQANPGEITPSALSLLHAMMSEALLDPQAFARWFGQYSSTPKYPEVDWRPEAAAKPKKLRKMLSAGHALRRNPASRFAFIHQSDAAVMLFVDGVSFDCVDETAAFAERLCAGTRITLDQASSPPDDLLVLIAALIDQGSLAFDEDG